MKTNKMIFCFIVVFRTFFFPFCCFSEEFVLNKGFSYQEIPKETQAFMLGKSYKENDSVKFEDLRLCKVKYIGFDEKEHEGELIVAHKIEKDGKILDVAKEVLEIFYELYQAKYPIEKIELIDYYNADDELSMKANNSSAFNFRYIIGTKKISWHGLGLAIDINPYVNPCIHPNNNFVEPAGTEKFAYDRDNIKQKGLIKKYDVCYNAFVNRGWQWGGDWNDPIDYMHFQKPAKISKIEYN